MSQQQVNKISAQKYLEKAEKMLLKQADSYYVKEHFKIGSDFDKSKFIFYALFADILCTEDCEVVTWVDKRIQNEDIFFTNIKDGKKL